MLSFSRTMAMQPSRIWSNRVRVFHAVLPSRLFQRSVGASDAEQVTLKSVCMQADACASLGIVFAGLVLPSIWWIHREYKSSALPVPLPAALSDSGAFVDQRLYLRESRQKGKGLFVAKHVAKGTVLMTLPEKVLLTGERAREILNTDLDPAVALCTLLAEAYRNMLSGHDVLGLGEYLLALPRSFPSLPFCFNDSDLDRELRGTALLPAVHALKLQSELDRQSAQKALGESVPALEDGQLWSWAQAVLLTRAGPSLHIQDDQSSCSAIVPLVDFANCAAKPTAECSMGPNGEINLVACQDIPANSEVTLNYGAQNQEQSLFTFGFALPETPIVVTCPLMLESQDSELRNKLLELLILERTTVTDSHNALACQLCRSELGVDTSELWTAANLFEMEASALQEVAKAVANTGSLPPWLSQQATPEARKRLRTLLEPWRFELGQAESKRGGVRFTAARSYRAECRRFVESAWARLVAEEAATPWAQMR